MTPIRYLHLSGTLSTEVVAPTALRPDTLFCLLTTKMHLETLRIAGQLCRWSAHTHGAGHPAGSSDFSERTQMQANHVIVDAASAGCVLANRLTEEPSTRVILIEAGGRDWNPLAERRRQAVTALTG